MSVSFLPPSQLTDFQHKRIKQIYKLLGELDGLMGPMGNHHLFISAIVYKESVASSTIEGTMATLEDVFDFQADRVQNQENTSKEQDIKEIQNYRKAIFKGLKLIKDNFAIDPQALMTALHSILLSSVRGSDKDPGQIRNVNVKIGNRIITQYIAPTHYQLPKLLENLTLFWHQEHECYDDLIKIAIIHYQFEAIHPFRDGNGRIGRLLIPLYLFSKKVIAFPYLYLSGFIEQTKQEYYDALREVDRNKNWNNWINYFLLALETQAQRTRKYVIETVNLHNQTRALLPKINSQYSSTILDQLFLNPIITPKELQRKLPLKGKNSIYPIIKKFEENGILVKRSARTRHSKYEFKALMDIIKKL